jgi:hypothetical protein
LPEYLRDIARRERGSLLVEPLHGDYACLMRYRRSPAP